MASNTSTFTLRLRTEGMDQAQAQSQAIRDNLQAAQGTSPGAGSTTSRRVASSAAARPTGAAGASAGAFAGQEVEDYNRARGAAGAAGGTARDFADQARGLGGLVRVYATVAANAFAAAAAFTALSDAMDTSNMIKGLDQLSAASGRSLGSLSQELVKATNGGISLREAMEATAKATSAGLSSSQVVELGKAATKASQALGLNLTDAVGRLSRGISKLEPELLDELGIYVKIDDAVEKYARTLGKTASSLTDYERRQAFATEALSQANKKFGEIELDTNPYTKLSASLKDIIQTSAEFINKFLGPVVKYLSESPVALGLAVAFVAKTVIQQALPALGQYRDSLKAATIDTALRAQELVKIQKELTKSRDDSAYKGASSALKETEAMKARLEQLKATAQTFSKSAGTDYSKKADVDPFAMNAEDLATLERRLELRAKVLDRTNSTEAAALRAHIVEIRAIYQAGSDAESDAQEAVEARDNKFYSQLNVTRVKAERALKQANRASILEETNKTQSLEGARAAWKKLNEELAKPQREISLGIDPKTREEITALVEKTKGFFGSVERGATRLRGGFGIAFQAVSDFAEAWGPKIGMAIGIATTAFEVLDGWLSTNKKELEEFSMAVEGSDKAIKTVSDTLAKISKQELGEALKPQNIEARANSFVELSNSLEKTGESFIKLNKASSGWDKAIDWTKSLIGKGSLDKFSTTLSSQIESALNAVDINEKGALEEQLKSILSVTDLDTSSITKALDTAGKEGAESLIENISKAIKEASSRAASDASKLKEALGIFESINKSYQDLANSLKDSSPLASFASGLVQESIKGQKALENLSTSVSYFIEILKDPNKLRIFDEKDVALLKDSEKELLKIARGTQQLEKDIRDGEAAMAALGKNTIKVYDEFQAITIEVQVDDAELQEKILNGYKAKAKLDVDAENIRGKLKDLLTGPITKGVQIAAAEFERSMRKTSLDVTSSLVSRLSGPGKAEAEFEIQKQRIQIEVESITAMYELVRSVERNTLTIKQRDIKEKLEKRGEQIGINKEIDVLETVVLDTPDKEFNSLQLSLKELTAGFKFLNLGVKVTQKDFNELSKTAPDLAVGLFSFFQQSTGLKSKTTALGGQLKIAEIARDLGISDEEFQVTQKRRKEALATLNADKERASILNGIYNSESQSLLLQKQITSEKTAQKEDEISREDILNKINLANQVQTKINEQKTRGKDLDSAQEKALELAKNTVIEANKELKAFDEQTKSRKELREVNNDIENQRQKSAALTKEAELQQQGLKNAEELTKIKLDGEKQEFDALVASGRLSEEYAAKRLAEIAQQNQALTLQGQIREAAAVRDVALRDAANKAAQAAITAAPGDDYAGTAEFLQATTAANKAYSDRAGILEAVNTQVTRGIELTKLQSLETAKQTEELKKQAEILGLFQGIADTLAQAFGKTGEVLGKFVGTIGEVIDNQETYNKKRAEQSKILDEVASKADSGYLSPDDMAKMNQATKTRNDLDKKNARDELTNNAKILGSAKTLFKEKTAAYKILGAMEKALHIARIAMDVKEMITDVSKTGVSIVESGKRMFASGQEAITAAFAAKPFPLGLIAGTAMIATIASIIGKSIGGGNSAPPVGFTAEEQQSAQGSGQVYRDGKLVDTGAGVLGDPTAKSESVAKGIDQLEKYSFKNLEYSNDMLDALKAIKKNTESFAGSLLKAIPGINLTPETLKSGNWLFGKETTETLDRGIKVIGNVGQIIDRSASLLQYTNTKTTDSGLLGIFGGGTSYGGDPGTPIQGASKLQKDLSLVFSSMGKALGSAAKTLGISTAEEVDAAFRSIDLSEQLKVSLMGLTGTDAAEAFLSVISSGLDTATLAIFPQLEKFQQVGETFGDTVIRLASDTRAVSLSFEELGMTLPKLVEQGVKPTAEQLNRVTVAQARYNTALAATKALNTITQYQGDTEMQVQVVGSEAATAALASALIELSSAQSAVTVASNSLTTRNLELVQSYIDAAGGLDEFIEKNRFFADNFLTEAERLVPVQTAVTTKLAELGLSFVDTREEFKAAVIAAQALGESGVDLYSSLMDLQFGFAEVYKETEKSLTVEEMRSKTLSQQLTILKLLGKSEEVLRITRAEELAELAKYPKAQADVLIANQNYIYALEDEQALKDKLIKQRDKEKSAINSTISSLKTSISTLENYRTALVGGDKSILTPLEKYQQSQTEFLKLQAAAQGPAGTEAEKAAQADAVSKLPAAADKFLESSRTLFASSDRYTADFNSVLSTVDRTSASLTAQKSTAELQLDELTRTTSFLDSIEDNTLTTATLLNQYLVAQEISKGLAQTAVLEQSIALSNVVTSVQEISNTIARLVAPPVDVVAESISATINALVPEVQTVFYDYFARTFGPPAPIDTPSVEPNPVVTELRSVREEISTLNTEIANLRTEQRAQTGAIITSNAQVTNLTAADIANSVLDGFRYNDWKMRTESVER